MSFYTYRDGRVDLLPNSIAAFKEFRKDFNNTVGDGFSGVYQKFPGEMTMVSKMKFEFDESPGMNVLDVDSIGRLVFVHQEVVSQITGVTNPNDLTCFVMTHPQIDTGELYVEEIYFQFPFIKANPLLMSAQLVPNLRHYFDSTGLHNKLEVFPVNEIDSIISGEIYSIGYWPLPGSYVNNSLLTITHVFDKILQEQVTQDKIIGYPPEAYFNTLQIPDNSEYDNSNSFYFANLDGFELIKRKKTQREKNRDVATRMIEERQREVKRSPAELCKIFLNMLNPQRYAIEDSRNKIGQVLFNVLRGVEEGLELWSDSVKSKLDAINNSFPDVQMLALRLGITPEQVINAQRNFPDSHPLRKDPQEIEEIIESVQSQCEEKWTYFEFTDCTIGTLRYWAMIDNPEKYKSFMQKDVVTLAWRCLNPTSSHTDAAKLVHARYSSEVVCASIKDNCWFGYWQHRWHELDRCHHLRVKVSDELPPIFETILDECGNEYKRAVSDDDKEKWSKLSRSATEMVKNAKTVKYKNDLITECAERFYDKEFMSKLDEDRTLLGCPNGVYELETGIFRPGKPEDFITLSTKAKYNDSYTWEHPRVKEVTYYLRTVYPDRELRHYVQKVFGTILEGGNMNKDFYNMIGEGDNSKSMIAKLLKLALGEYIKKVPVSMIMGKRGNADNATPYLADKKGIRALFVEEPPKGQSNVSVVKELSGNDDITGRALFKMPIIFSPQWKLLVFTNHMLEAPADEKAYWNRQKVIDHESTFCFNAPLSEFEQFEKKMFPRDPFFDRKLVAMAEPMLWCLTKWHRFFKEEGLIPPNRVMIATNLAKQKNDLYLQYIGSCLVSASQHESEFVEHVYADFIGWCKSTHQTGSPPKFQEFEEEMSKVDHLKVKPVDGKWIGVKIKIKNVVASIPTFVPLAAQQLSRPSVH